MCNLIKKQIYNIQKYNKVDLDEKINGITRSRQNMKEWEQGESVCVNQFQGVKCPNGVEVRDRIGG